MNKVQYQNDDKQYIKHQHKDLNQSMPIIDFEQSSRKIILPKINQKMQLHGQNSFSSRQRAYSEIKSIRSPRKKLLDKLIPLVELFDQMDILRQENGVEPINMIQRSEDDIQADSIEDKEFQQLRSIKQILFNEPRYDPEMHQLNIQIKKMRSQAEDYLRDFIREAKNDKFIMKKLEEGITKFQKERIQLNDKQGQIGAMKAQERIKETSHNQKMKIFNDLEKIMQLEQNTVKAGYLFNVLSTRKDPFKQKFKKDIQPGMEGRLNYIMTTKLQ